MDNSVHKSLIIELIYCNGGKEILSSNAGLVPANNQGAVGVGQYFGNTYWLTLQLC